MAKRLVSEITEPSRRLTDYRDRTFLFWGDSPEMQTIKSVIEQVSDSDVTVLIRGESGVGKELVARAIHQCSSRKNIVERPIHQRSSREERPFVKVNCAALPAELLESELFGHERGAFTGAATTHIGKFEQADTGTIFLDEIGEMKGALQAKLLHVLQDAQFTKLGSNRSIRVDVRVVAATNRDLETMLINGEFREDLYYRLKVIELTIPPLRERRREISHLTDFFMERYARRYNRPVRQLSDTLAQLFQTYDWPGNIRELENMVKRIVIFQDESLVVREMTRIGRPQPAFAVANVGAARQSGPSSRTQLPDASEKVNSVDEPLLAGDAPSAPQNGSKLADVAKSASMKAERALIEETLNSVHWHRRRAAEQLGVSYKTLLNKIKECRISRT
jgi:transcriptional regulator with PAS, ATPase and Fis domain